MVLRSILDGGCGLASSGRDVQVPTKEERYATPISRV
jgi:hypothetical protein